MAIRSQWKDLLIDKVPSLTLGKLFTEEERREISSLTTIFVAECRLGRSVLYRAQLKALRQTCGGSKLVLLRLFYLQPHSNRTPHEIPKPLERAANY